MIVPTSTSSSSGTTIHTYHCRAVRTIVRGLKVSIDRIVWISLLIVLCCVVLSGMSEDKYKDRIGLMDRVNG